MTPTFSSRLAVRYTVEDPQFYEMHWVTHEINQSPAVSEVLTSLGSGRFTVVLEEAASAEDIAALDALVLEALERNRRS